MWIVGKQFVVNHGGLGSVELRRGAAELAAAREGGERVGAAVVSKSPSSRRTERVNIALVGSMWCCAFEGEMIVYG